MPLPFLLGIEVLEDARMIELRTMAWLMRLEVRTGGQKCNVSNLAVSTVSCVTKPPVASKFSTSCEISIIDCSLLSTKLMSTATLGTFFYMHRRLQKLRTKQCARAQTRQQQQRQSCRSTSNSASTILNRIKGDIIPECNS